MPSPAPGTTACPRAHRYPLARFLRDVPGRCPPDRRWVVASTNVSGQIELSADPTEIFLLNDPDLPLGPVYVARDPNVYNTAFVFSPQGEIIAAARKPYITPIEESLLRFSYGPLRDLGPIDLGFARIGVITSKDAWMPDVLDASPSWARRRWCSPKPSAAGEFSTIPPHQEDWLPDNFLQSAGLPSRSTVRSAGTSSPISPATSSICPSMVSRPSSPTRYRGDRLGLCRAEPDGRLPCRRAPGSSRPGIADPSLSLQERRGLLRLAASRCSPASPTPTAMWRRPFIADIAPDLAVPHRAGRQAGRPGPQPGTRSRDRG
jgi:hypothetical protein